MHARLLHPLLHGRGIQAHLVLQARGKQKLWPVTNTSKVTGGRLTGSEPSPMGACPALPCLTGRQSSQQLLTGQLSGKDFSHVYNTGTSFRQDCLGSSVWYTVPEIHSLGLRHTPHSASSTWGGCSTPNRQCPYGKGGLYGITRETTNSTLQTCLGTSVGFHRK